MIIEMISLYTTLCLSGKLSEMGMREEQEMKVEMKGNFTSWCYLKGCLPSKVR